MAETKYVFPKGTSLNKILAIILADKKKKEGK